MTGNGQTIEKDAPKPAAENATRPSRVREWVVCGALLGGAVGVAASIDQVEADDARAVDNAKIELQNAEMTVENAIKNYERVTTADCNAFLAKVDDEDDKVAVAKSVYEDVYNVDGFDICGTPAQAEDSIDFRFTVQSSQLTAEEAREDLYEAQANAENLSDDGFNIAIGTVVIAFSIGSVFGGAAGAAAGQLDRRPQN